MTPFHRLALAASNSAFKNEDAPPARTSTPLAQGPARASSSLWATLRGAEPDFARFYAPLLYRGEHEIKPSFAQNERTALRERGRQLHGALHVRLPRRGLDAKGRLTLVVKDSAQRDRSRVQRRSLGHALAAGKEPIMVTGSGSSRA